MTAATAALSPEPAPGSGPGATADDDFGTWERQLTTAGECSHPIRLRGRIDAIDLTTGELAPVYDTDHEPGRVLHVACGNRREAVCPACSAIYKRDARQLVRAGLAGGKGIPETITAHPCVFATLTAPSFGPVHARKMRGKTVLPCRPRRDASARRCPHGRDISCPTRHVETDPRLGQPMCPDCFDYDAAVLFNLHAGDLWRRFTTYLPRQLARLAGDTATAFRAAVRIRYVKVAEYQARGVVHFHAVIRLDAAGDGYQPPPGRYTAALLADAIDQAAAAVTLVTGPAGPAIRLGFGTQTDTGASSAKATPWPAPARPWTAWPSRTTSPSTPPRPSALPACRATGCGPCSTSASSAARPTTGSSSPPAGSSPAAPAPMTPGCGPGRTCSATAATSSPSPAATPSPSASSAPPAPTTAAPSGTRTANATPGAAPLDDTTVLILRTWTYAGPAHTPTTPGAELALAAADRARSHHDQDDSD